MSVQVKFFDDAGQQLTTRRFKPGQWIAISGFVTGAAGIGEPFTHSRIEIPEIDFLWEGQTNIWGVFSLQLQLPYEPIKLTVKVTVTFTVSGQDVVLIPIAVGNVELEPLPEPPSQGTLSDDLKTALILGVVVVAAVFMSIVAVPSKVIALSIRSDIVVSYGLIRYWPGLVPEVTSWTQ